MNNENFDLKEMQVTIENIEQHTLKLKASGIGLPVVENNVRIILCAVHNLKFGIVDPAIVIDQ